MKHRTTIGGSDWASTAEAVAALGQSRDTIYERCRNRARVDAFPERLCYRTGGGYRIHRSLLNPAPIAPEVNLTDEAKDDIARRMLVFMWESIAEIAKGKAA